MSELLKQHIFKNGLILGLIYCFVNLLQYAVGTEYYFNPYVSLVSTFIIPAVWSIFHTLKYRSLNHSSINFRDAFSSCAGILFAAGFIEMVFQIALFNIIDTQFAAELLDVTINTMVNIYTDLGKSDDDISDLVSNIESSSNFSPLNMLMGFGFKGVQYTLFGLLVAAFTKNENPEFSE